MMGNRWRALRAERGIAAVEFALIMPLFAGILIGVGDLGFMIADRMAVNSALRMGIEASVMGRSASQVEAIVEEVASVALSAEVDDVDCGPHACHAIRVERTYNGVLVGRRTASVAVTVRRS